MDNIALTSLFDIASENTAKEVFLRCVVKKIGEIDTSKECFSAEVLIQARWLEPLFDGQFDKSLKEINVENLWTPILYPSNMLNESKDFSTYRVFFEPGDDKAFILLQRRLKGVFLENLELQEFPFDIQDITISLVSELTTDQVELIPDPLEPSLINVNSFVDAQEWRLFEEVITEAGRKTDVRDVSVDATAVLSRVIDRVRKKHPAINFKCRAQRRWKFFFWNVIFVKLFICLIAFSVFAVKYTLVQNRLQLTFVLLLTTISFRSTVNNILPKISYLTYMDIYILSSWVQQCLMVAWHAIVGLVISSEYAEHLDKILLITFAVAFGTFQLFFALFITFKLKMNKARTRKEMTASNQSAQARCRTISDTKAKPINDNETQLDVEAFSNDKKNKPKTGGETYPILKSYINDGMVSYSTIPEQNIKSNIKH